MSQSIKNRLLSSTNGLSDGLGNVVDAPFADQSSPWPLSQEDLAPDRNPFLEMSQDQIQKLDAVLSSEQAKRILGETSGQYELPEHQQRLPFPLVSDSSETLDKTLEDSLSYLMNGANLAMLGHKSEDFLQAFDASVVPMQVVGPDLLVEDVEVEMATEILAEEIPEDSECGVGFIENCILLDHNYCMIPVPEQCNEVQITAEDLEESDQVEKSQRDEGGSVLPGKKVKEHFSLEPSDSTMSPVRRSQRQIEKIEREQLEKIKAENAEIQRKEQEMIRVKQIEEVQKKAEQLLNENSILSEGVFSENSGNVAAESGGNLAGFSQFSSESAMRSHEEATKISDSDNTVNLDAVPSKVDVKHPATLEEITKPQTVNPESELQPPALTPVLEQASSPLVDDGMLPNEMLLEADKHSRESLQTDVLTNFNLEFPANICNEQSETLKSDVSPSLSTDIMLCLEGDKTKSPVTTTTSKENECTVSTDQQSKPSPPKKERKDSIDKIDEAFGRVVVRRPSEGSKKDSARKSYPKRENRKPPGYLMDMFEPALFSKPDRMKKIDSRYDYKFDTVDDDSRRSSHDMRLEPGDSVRTIKHYQSEAKEHGDLSDASSSFSSGDILQQCMATRDSKTNKIEEFLCKTQGDVMIVEHEHQDGVMDILEIKGSPVSSDAEKDSNPLTIDEDPPTQITKVEKYKQPLKDKGQLKEKKKKGVFKKQLGGGQKKAKRNGKRLHARRPKKAVNVSQHDNSDSDEGDDPEDSDDSEWCSEDDPDRLWCICKQPHNDRFMICCDKCKDWFHGSCVGVTRKFGRELEKSGKEWVCRKCTKERLQGKDTKEDQKLIGIDVKSAKVAKLLHNKKEKMVRDVLEPKSFSKIVKMQKRDQLLPTKLAKPERAIRRSQVDHLRKVAPGSKTIKDISKSSPRLSTEERSSSSQDRLLLSQEKLSSSLQEKLASSQEKLSASQEKLSAPQEKLSASQEKLSASLEKLSQDKLSSSSSQDKLSSSQDKLSASQDSHSSLQEKPPTQLCVMGCQRPARLNSVFCGNECILLHAGESIERKGLGREKEKKVLANRDPPKELGIIKRISVIERRTGRTLTGPAAPSEGNLQEWLKQHPTFEVLSPSQRIPERSFYGPQRKMIKLIQPQPMPVEFPLEGSKLKVGTKTAEKKEEPKSFLDPKNKPVPAEMKPKISVEVKPKLPTDQKMKSVADAKLKYLAELKAKALSTDVSKIKAPDISKSKIPTLEIKSKVNVEAKPKPALEIKVKSSTEGNLPRVQPPPPTPPSPQTSQGPEPVRLNVRKTLQEILTARSKDTDDTQISLEDIQKISLEIEEELFKMFSDTGTKYKAKYRSLMFNIKDQRNHGLFRKILRGKIKPNKLVRMTPEELASKELAMWREREAKHTLEMIKREQEEQQLQHTTIIKKTHKGEIEIDDDGLGFTEKPKSKPEAVPEPVSPMMVDTTESHRSHLFDLNCKICTGKMLAPSDGQPSPKKVRVAKSISLESKSQDENESDNDEKDLEQSDDPVEKPVESVKKEEPVEEKRKEEEDNSVKAKPQPPKDNDEEKSKVVAEKKIKMKDEPKEQSKENRKEKSGASTEKKVKLKDKHDKPKDKQEKQKDKQEKQKDKQEKPKDKQEKPKDKNKTDKLKSTLRKDKTKESSNKKLKKSGSERKSILKQDIADREPTSTVTIGSPDSALPGQSDDSISAQPSVWKGFVMMQEVAKFVTNAYKVSGPTDFLAQDIPDTIEVCGRIAYNSVCDYLSKVKQSGNKEFLVIRFSPANEEEKVAYMSFYTYLSSRGRLGVVCNSSNMIKDFYILPLASHSSVPATLMPFEGPGLEKTRPDMLLGVIIRHKGKKRTSGDGGSNSTSKSGKRTYHMADSIENSNDSSDLAIVTKDGASASKKVKFDLSTKSTGLTDADIPYEPSYTPPLKDLPKKSDADGSSPYEPSFTPPLDQMPKSTTGNDSPYSPGHSDPMEEDDADKPYDPEEAEEAVKMSKKIIPGLLAGSVSSQSVSELIDQISMSSNPTEITTTVLASIATATNLEQQRKLLIELTQKVEEQKRQLEMQKQQIATKVTAQVMGAMVPFSMVPTTSFPSSSNSTALSMDPKEGAKSTLPRLDLESLHQDVEAYSPSYTPPLEGPGHSRGASSDVPPPPPPPPPPPISSSTLGAPLKLPDTSNISLPPNLQEILESIKKQGAATAATSAADSSTGATDSKTVGSSGMHTATKEETKINVLEEDPIVKNFSGDVDDALDNPDDELPPGAESEKAKEELKGSSVKQSDPRLKGKTVQHDPRLKVAPATVPQSGNVASESTKKSSELGSLSATELMEKALKQFEDLPPPPPPQPSSSVVADKTSGVLSKTKATTKRRMAGSSKGIKSTDAATKSSKPNLPSGPLKEPPPPGLEEVAEDVTVPALSAANSILVPQSSTPKPMIAYPLPPPAPFVPPPAPPYPGPPPGFTAQPIFPAYQNPYPAPPHPGSYWAPDSSGHQQDWRGGGPRFRGRGRGGRWEGGVRGGWNDHHSQDSTPSAGSEWGFRDKDERTREWPRDRDTDRDDRDRYRERDRDRVRREDRRERTRDRDRDRDRSRPRDKDRARPRHRD